MKKILFILLFLPTLLFAQTEVSFMGVPFSYSSGEFVQELANKINHELSAEEKEYNMLAADCKFAGFDDCSLRVYPGAEMGVIDKTSETYRVEVSKAWDQREDMLKLKALYDTKYGTPSCNNSNNKEVRCIYIVGNVTIEFGLFYEDYYNPELPTEFWVVYSRNSTRNSALDDI